MDAQISSSDVTAPMRSHGPIDTIGLKSDDLRDLPFEAAKSFLSCFSALRRMPVLSSQSTLPALTLAVTAAGMLPNPAWAHIKWFAPYDVCQAPAPISGVLTQHFLLVFAGFTLLLVGSFLVDCFAATKSWTLANLAPHEDSEERLLRGGTAAFFMALFATGGTILTPELWTDADWPAWLQLGIVASMLSARTCAIGSLGILVLYGYGIMLYGFFHLSDYPMFIGLAAYLALTSLKSGQLRSQRMLVLYVSICVSLMWGAIEKWAYPQWTFPLLADRQYLTFGLSSEDFMIVAGFVEFAFAFYILIGLGLLRLAILGLGTIFAAAIVDFGKIDAIGHLPILIALAAMFLHGPTQLQVWFHNNSEGILLKARIVGASFVTAVFVFFAAYYGLQHAEYGRGPLFNGFAAFATPIDSR
jgi:hypothetical protein